ncbi:MAG: hypothetical protein A3H96_06100 [Acidobacteria bacterium RIFCSPLOWO2_02_FULL_67_36]|nr:MAG: hypothetical protein A3H96_06100 [Acidobacteria bacterium RIFCSPLOWO2_02_FULL_67_36]OFW20208.1 MAG: hypothetical protein A3G21_26410 [Acidobacteria bacterium RIFCSPLOWO2_12_FULL_66_21]
MDDTNDIATPPAVDGETNSTAAPASTTTEAPAAPAPVSEAVLKFKSCRWRSDKDAGEFCTHRDVLPFAGKEGFSADSWCPECSFYKLRRTPKKREYTY